MMINLDKVKYNPYRDLKLDPINQSTVDKMVASITDLGFWGGLAVRKVGDSYELAFGHHRLEALRQIGEAKADLNIVGYDEDQMVRAMVVENATQRGNEGGATLDSVAGIVRRIGYLLLTESDDDLGCSKIFGDADYVKRSRNSFLAGNGIGEDIICRYEPSLAKGSESITIIIMKLLVEVVDYYKESTPIQFGLTGAKTC